MDGLNVLRTVAAIQLSVLFHPRKFRSILSTGFGSAGKAKHLEWRSTAIRGQPHKAIRSTFARTRFCILCREIHGCLTALPLRGRRMAHTCYFATNPSSSILVLISASLAHCFSVGSFRGIDVATVTIESSVGLRSCFCRAQLWSSRQYAGPSSTTSVCICMPVMTLCCA